MTKSTSVRFSEAELLMLREAVRIAAEEGSLIGTDDKGNLIPDEEEREERIQRKLNAAIAKVRTTA